MFIDRLFLALVFCVGGLAGSVAYMAVTVGQVDPIGRVISQGDDVQIVGVVETLDSRVVTFINEGSVYTASYNEGGELLVGEVYFLTEGKDLVPVGYRAKE